MQKFNVLIVDDESELRQSVTSILTSALPDIQFQIRESSNGKEALAEIKKTDFDLVMMDVRMPEMNGQN